MKALQELISELTWFDLINKLKKILRLQKQEVVTIDTRLIALENQGSGGVQSVNGYYVDNTDPINPILKDPRPYKVYSAIISQNGTNPPIAIILENTLGVLQYMYGFPGEYYVTSSGLFTTNKTAVFINGNTPRNSPTTPFASVYVADSSTIIINSGTVDGTSSDGVIYNQTFLEIRVYN